MTKEHSLIHIEEGKIIASNEVEEDPIRRIREGKSESPNQEVIVINTDPITGNTTIRTTPQQEFEAVETQASKDSIRKIREG